MKNRLFIDVHAIQTLPPSNINRDDTGSPKTAQYGGIRRARVSSQSWKRAIREYFYENSTQENVGIRSLNVVEYVADKIMKLDSSIGREESLKMADGIFNEGKVKTKDYKAKALFFLGESQANKLAKAAVEGVSNKDTIQEIFKSNPAIDIALFGRMVADDPYLNEDASCQVAHSISTHGIQTEFDFFTAVDDLAPQDNAGAGMLGTVEFNSSTMYRYANVAVHELLNQLDSKEATINTLKTFVEAFANSLPTGKVNTFANQTLPQFIMVNLRNDRPVSLVSAFEEPVKSSEGFVDKSIEKLVQETERVEKFVEKPICTIILNTRDMELSEEYINSDNMRNLLNKLGEELEVNIDESQGE